MNGEEMAREPFLDPPMTLADRERALHGGPRWCTENAGRVAAEAALLAGGRDGSWR